MQLDEAILQTLERDLGEALENAHHNQGALSADDQYRLIQVDILCVSGWVCVYVWVYQVRVMCMYVCVCVMESKKWSNCGFFLFIQFGHEHAQQRSASCATELRPTYSTPAQAAMRAQFSRDKSNVNEEVVEKEV